jgi:hypothetical protein
MDNKKIKNIILMASALIIVALSYKLLFDKNKLIPNYRNNKKGKPSLSPYHDHQVKNTIMKNRSGIIKCYNKFIDTDPKISNGRTKVDFEINEDGDVIKSGIIAGIGDEEMHHCIKVAIKSWKFPEPNISSPVYVDHSFNFKKRSKEKVKSKKKYSHTKR